MLKHMVKYLPTYTTTKGLFGALLNQMFTKKKCVTFTKELAISNMYRFLVFSKVRNNSRTRGLRLV